MLKSSEKQIAWAKDIRQNAIYQIELYVLRHGDSSDQLKEKGNKAIDLISKIEDASEIINRQHTLSNLLYESDLDDFIQGEQYRETLGIRNLMHTYHRKNPAIATIEKVSSSGNNSKQIIERTYIKYFEVRDHCIHIRIHNYGRMLMGFPKKKLSNGFELESKNGKKLKITFS